jgi:glycosyltransferase involved in cell wall biosynthesis
VYNGAKYLEKTVSSVLSQDYPQLELVFIDDGSTDDSRIYLTKLAEREKHRVRVFENKRNIGVCRTLRRALDNARGEFVVLMGQDDCFEPDFLRSQIDHLKASNALAVFSAVAYIGSHGEDLGEKNIFRHHLLDLPRHELFITLANANFLCAPSAVIRNIEDLDKIQGFCNDRLHDYELWLALLCRGTIAYNPSAKLLYRIHDDNYSRADRRISLGKYDFYSVLNRILHSPEYKALADDESAPPDFEMRVLEQIQIRFTYAKPLLLLTAQYLEDRLLSGALPESSAWLNLLARTYKRLGLLTRSHIVFEDVYPERLSLIVPEPPRLLGTRKFIAESIAFTCVPRNKIEGKVNERFLWLVETSLEDFVSNDLCYLRALQRGLVVFITTDQELKYWKKQFPQCEVISHTECLTPEGLFGVERRILSYLEDSTPLYETNLFGWVDSKSGFEDFELLQIEVCNLSEQPRLIGFPDPKMLSGSEMSVESAGNPIEVLDSRNGSYLLSVGQNLDPAACMPFRLRFSKPVSIHSHFLVNNRIFMIRNLGLEHGVAIGYAYPVGYNLGLI